MTIRPDNSSPAPGTVDTTFDPGTGANGYVFGTAVQPDGKVVIVGGFSSVNDVPHNSIARLNPDGTLDSTFNPTANREIFTTALQPDGKVIIGGAFTTVNGVTRNRLARLNADGSLDADFDPGAGPSSDVLSVARQPDG